jgi:hypothetical protein
LRELTLEEISAICVAIKCRVENIKLELEEHDLGIHLLEDDEFRDLADALYFCESWLLYKFQKAEKQSFGLRDATNPGAGPYPGTAADDLVMLTYAEISYVRGALESKAGHIEMELRGNDIDDNKRGELKEELLFYERLTDTFRDAMEMSRKLRALPQIAYRHR